jgi:hypothetical protein
MATQANETIRKGRNYSITVSVSGVSDWTDKSAVMNIATSYDSDPALSIVGSIDTANDKITYLLTPSQTGSLSIRTYYFESTVYEGDRSYVKDTTYGTITVVNVIDTNPTD